MTDLVPAGRPGPTVPGCHHCGAPTEHQHQRHATQAEYDAIGPNHKPIDGRATIAVGSCGDHAIMPFCDHTPPPEQPCPTCHAAAGQPCTTPDGSERAVEHPARITAKPQMQTCTHAHREDCAGYGACQCTDADPAPVRTGRRISP